MTSGLDGKRAPTNLFGYVVLGDDSEEHFTTNRAVARRSAGEGQFVTEHVALPVVTSAAMVNAALEALTRLHPKHELSQQDVQVLLAAALATLKSEA